MLHGIWPQYERGYPRNCGMDRPLPRYTSSLLTVPHGLFTSAGGVSSGPFAALNLSFHVGDREDNVRSNRALYV